MVVLAVLNLHPAYRALLERAPKNPPVAWHDRPADYLAILVDDRVDDPDVRAVYDEVSAMLGPEWAMEWRHPVSAPNPTQVKDALKLSTDFWAGLVAVGYSRVLWFESDCVMTGRPTPEFMQYDYIGAVCGGFDGRPTVLNGGFSLRNPAAMLEALTYRPLSLGVSTLRSGEQRLCEDVFFTRALRDMGANVAPDEVANRFALESTCEGQPVGVHRTLDPLYHSDDLAWRVSRGTVF